MQIKLEIYFPFFIVKILAHCFEKSTFTSLKFFSALTKLNLDK